LFFWGVFVFGLPLSDCNYIFCLSSIFLSRVPSPFPCAHTSGCIPQRPYSLSPSNESAPDFRHISYPTTLRLPPPLNALWFPGYILPLPHRTYPRLLADPSRLFKEGALATNCVESFRFLSHFIWSSSGYSSPSLFFCLLLRRLPASPSLFQVFPCCL